MTIEIRNGMNLHDMGISFARRTAIMTSDILNDLLSTRRYLLHEKHIGIRKGIGNR